MAGARFKRCIPLSYGEDESRLNSPQRYNFYLTRYTYVRRRIGLGLSGQIEQIIEEDSAVLAIGCTRAWHQSHPEPELTVGQTSLYLITKPNFRPYIDRATGELGLIPIATILPRYPQIWAWRYTSDIYPVN